MTSILIVYGTTEGHTRDLVAQMREAIEARGHTASVVEARDGAFTIPLEADGVIVGGAVHVGRQDARVRRFVKEHREQLEAMPSAFFQVCLNAADSDPAAVEEGNRELLETFVADTGWRPGTAETFAGMLAWTRYGFVKRLLMRRIVRTKVPPEQLDTGRDVDYTDYAAVRRFAEEFASSVAGNTALDSPQ